MSQFIYMTEDTICTPMTECIIFKAGHSINPIRRGGQMKQAARRAGIAGEVQMKVERYTVDLHTEDKEYAAFVEGYVLSKIASLPTAEHLSREFFSIGWRDREYCYQHLTEWVNEAMRLWGEG